MPNLIFGFILGMVLGSFSAAVADRLNTGQTILGRSNCVSCKKPIAPYDLIPVISFLILRGRCRKCGDNIPIITLLTEISMGLIISLLFYKLGELDPLAIIFLLFIVCVFVIIFLTDLKTGYIFDKVTYPAIGVTLAFHLFNLLNLQKIGISSEQLFLFTNFPNYIFAGVGSALFFSLLIIITRGKGMGWGDVKYVLLLGLVFGWPLILVVLFLSFLLGSVFSVGLIIFGKKSFGQTIPFGPFLSMGAMTGLLFGGQLLSWYLVSLIY